VERSEPLWRTIRRKIRRSHGDRQFGHRSVIAGPTASENLVVDRTVRIHPFFGRAGDFAAFLPSCQII
jgi:hypothetical protein